MAGFSDKVDDSASLTPARKGVKRRRLKAAAVSLLLASGAISGVAATTAPADASLVYNMMLCEPDTGWCFQTNPPYNPAYPHECQWDFKLNGNNLHSGMWYTGCDVWWPKIT